MRERIGLPKRRWIPLLLFALALVVRLVVLAEMHANGSPDPYAALDQMENRYWARTLLAGDWLGREAGFPEDVFYRSPVFFKPPLYPYLLALLLGLGGGSLLVVQLVQAVVSALACPLTYRLARRLGGSRAVGAGAGVALAVHGPSVVVAAQLLAETFYVTATLAILVGATSVRARPGAGRAVALGAACGLAALLRPNLLLFVPFLAGWLWRGLRTVYGDRQVARWTLLGGAALAACLLPVTVRNAVVGGDRVVLSTYGGYNFYVGNHPECRAGTAHHDMEGYHAAIVERARSAGRRLRASEIEGVAWDLAFANVAREPARFGAVLLDKAYRLGNAYEMMSNQSPYLLRRYSRVLAGLVWYAEPWGFPLGVAVPLGLLGCVAALRRRRAALGLLYLAAGALGLLAFFVTFRHRLPLVPVLLIFSAFGVATLREQWRRSWRRGAACLLAVAAAAVVVNSNWDGLDRASFDATARRQLEESQLNRAAALCETGDYARAAAVLREALPAAERPVASVALACLLAAAPDAALRDGPVALRLARDARRGFGETPEALFAEASALAEAGDRAAAVGLAEGVLARLPAGRPGGTGRTLREALAHWRAGRPWRLPPDTRRDPAEPVQAPRWRLYLPPWSLAPSPAPRWP
jgi:4-amino-4-deoxy-L-arabinose transferase-like glycosyltransferase